MERDGEAVQRPAALPDGDLACDFTVARETAAIRGQLAQRIATPARPLDDGVEVTFGADSWDMVLRYIEAEARCCPFLSLAARRGESNVVLTITGRPDARDFISNIFAPTG